MRLIVHMICEAIGRVDESADAGSSGTGDGISDWLQKNRASQLAFLVGGRGTGKTTVLATLVKLARSASTRSGDVLPVDVKDGLVNIGKRVVWLEPMDMEVVTSSTNMIAAVLARIDAACPKAAARGPARRGETRGLLDPQSDDEPLIGLQKLQNRIALGWSDYSSAQLSRTDPDTAAIEMLRQESTRLSLNADLAQVLSKLASTAFRSRPISDPLFVLPVDDFDLNPPSVLQMLRVLRLISVPRLFFLILGNLEVAEVVLNLKLSNDLADVADGVDKEMLSIMPGEVASVAGMISANAARKLIPPAQRVNLTQLSLFEAINFRPLGHHETDDALFELMAKLPVELNPATRPDTPLWKEDNLWAMLSAVGHAVYKPPVRSSDEEPKAAAIRPHRFDEELLGSCSYSAREMFQSPARKVADFWYSLSRLVESDERRRTAAGDSASLQARAAKLLQDDLQEYFANECRASLAEEPVLSPTDRRLLPHVFEKTPTGEWDLAYLPFRPFAPARPRYHVEAADHAAKGKAEMEIILKRTDGWLFILDKTRARSHLVPGTRTGTGTGAGGEQSLLSQQTAAAITLFHDLAASGRGNLRSRTLLFDLREVVWGAETDWRLNRTTAAGLPWPTPPCMTFFALDRFLFAWNNFVEQVQDTIINGPDGLKLAVFVWIAAGTAAIRSELPQTLAGDNPLPSDWTNLFQKAAECKPNDKDHSPQASRHRDWLNGIAMFYLPELKVEGLPQPAELIEYWKSQWRAISRQRAQALAIVYKQTSPELAKEIRKAVLPEFFSPPKRWTPTLKFVEALAMNKPNPQDDDPDQDDVDTGASASAGSGAGGPRGR